MNFQSYKMPKNKSSKNVFVGLTAIFCAFWNIGVGYFWYFASGMGFFDLQGSMYTELSAAHKTILSIAGKLLSAAWHGQVPVAVFLVIGGIILYFNSRLRLPILIGIILSYGLWLLNLCSFSLCMLRVFPSLNDRNAWIPYVLSFTIMVLIWVIAIAPCVLLHRKLSKSKL